MKKTLWRYLIGGLFLFFSTTSFAAEETFITVADIHFNPFIECEHAPRPCPILKSLSQADVHQWEKIFEKSGKMTLGGYYQDTDFPLLKSSLNELNKVNEAVHPRFVLVLGDFLGHKFRNNYRHYSLDRSTPAYRAFVKKTLQFLTLELRKTFPNVDVYAVLGNNDSYTGDYSVVPHGAFLADAANDWSTLIVSEKNREQLRMQFPIAGYYAVTLKHPTDVRLIVLDTVLFSIKFKSSNGKDAANQEIQWLHEELENAKQKHQKVLLAFHIPVDFDFFGTLKSNFGTRNFWQPEYTHAFEIELRDYAEEIIAMLPAHVHVDVAHAYVQKEFSNVPWIITPSISPIFGNNPGFKVFSFDVPFVKIKKYDAYFLALNSATPTWLKEYSY